MYSGTMATWVIGDIHGCWETLQRLLGRTEWKAERDELWLVGDLVNRGPSSLEVLRWAREHSERLVAVLGNHDLHLLARAAGVAAAKKEDTLDEVLAAPDRDGLLGWLRARPLVHRFGPFVMVHGGLMPEWNIELTCGLAGEVGAQIAGVGGDTMIRSFYANRKVAWSADMLDDEQLAAAAAVFTRLRMVDSDGHARLDWTGPPGAAPDGWMPWYARSAVRSQGYRLIFGHWAQLGFYRAHDVVCLDSGCVYGGRLTALCLDDGRIVQEEAVDATVGPEPE
jgi:bis(5'-nucleosyl)-tetraphosphatase (symmetrical)